MLGQHAESRRTWRIRPERSDLQPCFAGIPSVARHFSTETMILVQSRAQARRQAIPRIATMLYRRAIGGPGLRLKD